MRSSSLYLAFQLVPLVLGAPIGLPQVLRVSQDEGNRVSVKRWRGLPRTAPEVIPLRGGLDDTMFDNRPQRITKSDPISKVLGTERPIPSEYLLSIPRGKTNGHDARGNSETMAQRRIDAEDEDMLEISDMDISIAIPTSAKPRTPCQYARLSGDRNDVLVVMLAVAFLLAVLLVESWASFRRSFGWMVSRHGPIRLEDEEKRPHQPLSIRSSEMEETEKLNDRDCGGSI
ncbi:hypothetical protein QBC47DRAFT_365418 [Echria macrotheca]|uniref:Uncharacterized protein n=1 Tax=Echria macrotheca TaxID=438768 RepID=A0AAJ0F6K2_9PEZI|nr:hypothetical protein QBC47DRAFT_365418 [Echria macrotheca]